MKKLFRIFIIVIALAAITEKFAIAQIARDFKKLESPEDSKPMGYLAIEGTKQGKLKGDNPAIQGKSAFLGYSLLLSAPIDQTTGLMSGKMKQGSVTILKNNGASTPQIIQAMATNEMLKSVTIEFIKSQPGGGEIIYYSVKLKNAHITKINQTTDKQEVSAKNRVIPFDEITFIYQQIEFEHKEGNTMSVIDGSNN